ncbi:PEP-CTERM sorting domain-containing protein [Geomesophilobacter sediminis]|uniref:PEP-CTERM sorting domain-containing protein n=1 Tax=Geomesophilobacter sediminis TaxID=2798584 RepID=A0A8J7IMR3_9BACT|nr:PEP-CTERM sorting domain-containing protein [Geomesophilobacter sediminis]MBJ6723079.1 PEP-CTERM sorting domain-containing protein [Geomesophilobacter sediminis]
MKKLLAIILLMTSIGTANATTLNFDDIYLNPDAPPPASSYAPLAVGYGGFNWDNLYVFTKDSKSYADTGYERGVVSGTNAVYNGFGMSASMAGGLFDFMGASFTAARIDGLTLDIKGLKAGQILYDRTITLTTESPAHFDLEFLGIDTLSFDSGNLPRHQFVMDDFTFTKQGTSPNGTGAIPVVPVPEPGSFLLVGAGLVGLLMSRRHRVK